MWKYTEDAGWEELSAGEYAPPFTARAFGAAVSFSDRLWLLGGMSDTPSTADGGLQFFEVWATKDGRQWFSQAPLPTGLAYFQVSTLGSTPELWTTGGLNSTGMEVWYADVTYEFNTIGLCPLLPPSSVPFYLFLGHGPEGSVRARLELEE